MLPKISQKLSLSSSRNWSNIIESMCGFMWRFFLRYAIHYNGFICNKYMKEDSCMDIEEIRSSSFRALKLIFMARKTYFLGHKFIWLFCGFLVRWRKKLPEAQQTPKSRINAFCERNETVSTPMFRAFFRGLVEAEDVASHPSTSVELGSQTPTGIFKNQ